MQQPRSIGGHVADLAGVAVRSFAAALAVLTGAGVALAAVSFYVLRDRPGFALLAALLAFAEGIATGFVLGAKRAVVMTLAHALAVLRLGGRLVRLLFDRMLGAVPGGEAGERGGTVARALERLPLAQAERLLAAAVAGATGAADDEGGWLRRVVRARLLALVRKYTLARFRDEDARHGGVDLVQLKSELEERIDDALAARVRGSLRVWTALAVVALPAVVAAQTYVVAALLK
jgi:hypothetical protein